jgi:serine protease AprX
LKDLGLSFELWPHATGNSQLWVGDDKFVSRMPTIAIVDSGIDTTLPDFAGRILADVKLASLADGAGDTRGHGTFVAGIAGGAGAGFAGAAPDAKLVSLDVMNEQGMAYTSDVIAAADWILANKETYNIRVANFSLHSARQTSFRWDPLNRAVEKLWFSGVVVVAAAGNYGTESGPSGIPHAPGNDPFVITVGALDLKGTARTSDDGIAPWSAWGYTLDGFAKPDLVAPGRYMVGPVPTVASLAVERPEKVLKKVLKSGTTYPGSHMELSGTSFAAPVVAGTVAQMLARRPELTPDQVKGLLMLTARPVPSAPAGAAGVGQLTASKAATHRGDVPNPNLVLNRFVVADPNGGSAPVFDAAAWSSTAQQDAAWNSAAWNSAAWNSAAWNSAAWNSAAWNSAAWNSAAWNSAAWSSGAVADSSQEDAAEGEAPATDPYEFTDEDDAYVLTAPDLAIAPEVEPLP